MLAYRQLPVRDPQHQHDEGRSLAGARANEHRAVGVGREGRILAGRGDQPVATALGDPFADGVELAPAGKIQIQQALTAGGPEGRAVTSRRKRQSLVAVGARNPQKTFSVAVEDLTVPGPGQRVEQRRLGLAHRDRLARPGPQRGLAQPPAPVPGLGQIGLGAIARQAEAARAAPTFGHAVDLGAALRIERDLSQGRAVEEVRAAVVLGERQTGWIERPSLRQLTRLARIQEHLHRLRRAGSVARE